MRRELKVGLFAVAVLLVGWGVIRFLQGSDVFSSYNTYYAYYDNVGGIQPASPVMIQGVKVGSVLEVELNEDPTKGVEVTLSVEERYGVPADSKAKIFSDGLMGGKAVEIVLGNSSQLLQEGDTICSSHDRDLMDVAGSELDFFKQRFVVLADNLNATLDNLNSLMQTNASTLASTMQHIESLTDDASELLRAERANLEAAIEGLATFATMLGENAPRIDSLIDGANAVVAKLDEEAFAEKLSDTVERLNGLLAQIERGEGTVGSLMKDQQMYANLTEASGNLAALLSDLKEHPSRYVHFSLFGKDAEKQQRKAEKRAAKAAEKVAKEENQ